MSLLININRSYQVSILFSAAFKNGDELVPLIVTSAIARELDTKATAPATAVGMRSPADAALIPRIFANYAFVCLD